LLNFLSFSRVEFFQAQLKFAFAALPSVFCNFFKVPSDTKI